MAVDWTQLPPELIQAVSEHLNSYTDYLTLRATCPTWLATLPKTPLHILPPQLPHLLTLTPQNHLTFHNLTTHNSRNLATSFMVPPNKNSTNTLFTPNHNISPTKRCRFSSQGYLIFLDENPEILVLNPLTRFHVTVPPLTKFDNIVVGFSFDNVGREYVVNDRVNGDYTLDLRKMRDLFIKKFVFSGCPRKCGDGLVAMVILGGCGSLCYWRNGESCWRVVDAAVFCDDVVFHDGLFYGVDKSGVLVVCNFSGGECSVMVIDTLRLFCGDMLYLVSCGDELMMVSRFLSVVESDFSDRLVYKTVNFSVFRIVIEEWKWEMVRSLGDNILFVGGNSSLALSALDFRGTVGDAIYFTDEYSESNLVLDGIHGENDLGVYKLCDGSIEDLPCFSAYSHDGVQWPSPLWVSLDPC